MHIQAKRLIGSFGIEEVQRIRGTLGSDDHGVIVTTSYFTKQAQEDAFDEKRAMPSKSAAVVFLYLTRGLACLSEALSQQFSILFLFSKGLVDTTVLHWRYIDILSLLLLTTITMFGRARRAIGKWKLPAGKSAGKRSPQ